jgi:ABC-2 type transport system ATP-binding protein
LIAPTAGRIAIEGVALTAATSGFLRKRIGFLTETPGLWDRLTVRENLRVYADLYALPSAGFAVDRAIELFELGPQAAARTAELSKGMRQKVALARALLHGPSVLLLDEPMSGLDPEIRRTVRLLLEERRAAGCSILVSTHDLDEAERLADRVAVLQARLIALDRPRALRQRLTTGRLLVRVAGDPLAFLPVAATIDPGALVEGGAIVAKSDHVERDTPALVAALVAAGAQILEVRPEMPALEDVYLHLMDTDA